ncbi:hypothetical protein PWY87_30650 [Kribbella solani]|uniref:hypothetical protein n=1 Tax=Kribbella solani TaxID=236067 RepID=UPI0029AA0EF7|nr:hypothetical protein [Kribbella solani]MDX2969170.1 hypothetical protein [Kribbella solani]MDX3006075.1 hypothetical protein [Kribbella solani]
MISIKSVGSRLLGTLVAGAAAGTTLLVPSAAQAAGTAATTATATTAGTATTAVTRAAAVPDVLLPGQYLKPGQYRRSKNGIYALVMQADGNAVLIKGRTPIWATMTNRKASTLIMQRDGNLVVISGRTPVWASGTDGSTGAHLEIQNDSNLVIYNTRHKAAWSRYMIMVTLGSGRNLTWPNALYSHNRIYRLQLQSDGNAVIVKNGRTPIWSTKTISKGGYATMQTDGNFVVYSAAKRPLWATKTVRHGAVLQMQDDGNLVVVYGRTPIWASNTGR